MDGTITQNENQNSIGNREGKRIFRLPSHPLRLIGFILILFPIFFLLLTFYKIIYYEFKYTVTNSLLKNTKISNVAFTNNSSDTIVPASKEFGIIIPKININSPIILNVDPYDSSKYQKALTLGVAHALGTATPDINGNMFLFAHSSTNFYEASRYNSIFYLINKLENGDNIFISYKGDIYEYKVTEIKNIKPEEISYLEKSSDSKKITLMTCWPPGTNIGRKIVIGEQVE